MSGQGQSESERQRDAEAGRRAREGGRERAHTHAGALALVLGSVHTCALLAGGGLVYGVFTGHPRQQEPLAEAAAKLQQEWPFACGPAYVMGDFWSAYGIGPAMSPPRPGVHLIEMRGAPGYEAAKREREGAIVIYRDRLNLSEIGAVFPALDLSAPRRMTLPLARTWSGGVVSYEFVFVAPKGC